MTSSLLPRHVQDIFITPQDVLKMSARRFQGIVERKKLYILEGKKLLCSRCLQGLFETCLEDVFRISWRSPKVWWLDSVYIFFLETVLSLWIYYSVIHEMLLWCLDFALKHYLDIWDRSQRQFVLFWSYTCSCTRTSGSLSWCSQSKSMLQFYFRK